MNDRGYLEFGMKMLDESRRLIIDGTAEFIKGLPKYGTLLSLYHKVLVEEAGGKFVKVEERLIDGKDRHAIILGKPKVVDWLVDLTSI